VANAEVSPEAFDPRFQSVSRMMPWRFGVVAPVACLFARDGRPIHDQCGVFYLPLMEMKNQKAPKNMKNNGPTMYVLKASTRGVDRLKSRSISRRYCLRQTNIAKPARSTARPKGAPNTSEGIAVKRASALNSLR